MDDYTKLTKHWLDIRYRDRPDLYMAHEPVYGLGHPGSEPNHPRRIARLYQLLRRVRQAGGRTMIDVGGAEGYFAFLCRELFGMEAVNVDISPHACRRAAEMFKVPGVAVDSVRLPFADATFDLVTCAEVLEHLANPVPSVMELQRIAKESLVLSTEMWKEKDADRDRLLAERDGTPHGERSIFADSDLKPLLSPYEVKYERQVVPDWSTFHDDRKIDKAKLRAALVAIDQLDPHAEEGTYGIVMLVRKRARTPPPKSPTDAQILDYLLDYAMPPHPIPAVTPVVPLQSWCTMACPGAGGQRMRTKGTDLECPGCGTSFPLDNGTRDMFCPRDAKLEEHIDLALKSRGGAAYRDQRGDLLQLGRKLSMDVQPQTLWRWPDGGGERWDARWQIVHEGGSKYRVTGGDPQIASPWIGLQMRRLQTIEVRMRVVDRERTMPYVSQGEVFGWFGGDVDFNRDPICFKVNVDGDMHTYSLTVPDFVRGKDPMLLKLRVDPTTLTSEVHMESVRLITVP